MFEELWEKLISFLTSRILVMIALMVAIAIVMIHRVFDLQIVHGEEYMDSFETRIRKEKTIEGARGNIYDRNGKLLAYNELAHSVVIEDVYESGTLKNYNLNTSIYKTIQIIEGNGDKLVSDFQIELDPKGNYKFKVTGTTLLRFLADVYGYVSIDDLSLKQKASTADEVINYLAGWDRFRIGEYTKETKRADFVPGNGYTKSEVLKILNVRFDMNNNSYQKYISTTIANDVSEKTVAVIMENNNELQGVTIAEATIRKYVDAKYLSNIIGYTGKISSTEELAVLQEDNQDYSINDVVGKLGIEKSMESYLQGRKGSETLFVNSVGKTTEVADYVEAVAGNDVYLTIDKDIQIAIYKILEENLAGILCTKLINTKDFDASEVAASKIQIPIYDVYIALFENNVININHLSAPDAKDNEQIIYNAYLNKCERIDNKLRAELFTDKTVYSNLSKEYQVYESFLVDKLYSSGILDKSLIDTKDRTYIAWTTDETISACEYINYCISKNWVDISKLELSGQYSDSAVIYEEIVEKVLELLRDDLAFRQKVFKYMIKQDDVSGLTVCKALVEQDVLDIDESVKNRLFNGQTTAYSFMYERIKNIDITPAQLALDPCSASCVITDVNSGDVIALVSYPGFDNNKLANGVDSDYYAQLQADLSTPMINYATRHKTAPGSTFKMVSATAGLMEGVITPYSRLSCSGLFDKIVPAARCWAYPSAHGSLSVSEAIRHSCNMFFYELGYQMGSANGVYNSDLALSRLKVYADAYGLTDVSGVEIEESAPTFSTEDGVRSCIGQGNNAYTTAQLARYITTVANSGTCYNLTLLDKVTDKDGNTLLDNEATVRNTISMDQSYWNSIHYGMRMVVENNNNFRDFGIKVAGKTGTAEESRNRANHALFVCYAPYERPDIAVATRLAFGYSSSYAAKTTRDVLNYYYGLNDADEVITGTASALTNITTQTD